MSPKIVTVWNPSSQLSLGNSDPSFQEIFFNWNRNSCISYLPENLHCCKNPQIPVQKPRQPISEDSVKTFEDRSARTESADDRSWNIQEFPVTYRKGDRMASDSVIRSLFPSFKHHAHTSLLDSSPEASASLGIHGSPAVFYAEQLPSCPVCFHSYTE